MIVKVNNLTEQILLDEIIKFCVEEREISRECIQPKAKFIDDLGIDSLDILEMVVILEHKYNIRINENLAREVSTVQEAIDLIMKSIAK